MKRLASRERTSTDVARGVRTAHAAHREEIGRAASTSLRARGRRRFHVRMGGSLLLALVPCSSSIPRSMVVVGWRGARLPLPCPALARWPRRLSDRGDNDQQVRYHRTQAPSLAPPPSASERRDDGRMDACGTCRASVAVLLLPTRSVGHGRSDRWSDLTPRGHRYNTNAMPTACECPPKHMTASHWCCMLTLARGSFDADSPAFCNHQLQSASGCVLAMPTSQLPSTRLATTNTRRKQLLQR